MSVREYIGARYVPVFADPIQWDSTLSYEPLTVVTDNGTSYVSRQSVPPGTAIDNESYWVRWADYNAQLEEYIRQVQTYSASIETLNDSLPIADFSSANTVKDYIDDSITAINNVLPVEDFSSANTVKDYVDALGALLPSTEFDNINTVKGYIDASNAYNAFAFDTVSDMVTSSNLSNGVICHTNGFNAVDDGGAAWYVISDTLPSGVLSANEMDVITCEDLYALLIVDETYNPCQFGADKTGIADSSTAINAFVEKNEGSTIHFVPGVYRLSNPIETDYENTTSIDFHGAKLVTDLTCECALYVGHKNVTDQHSGGGNGEHDHYPNRRAYFNNFYIESYGNYAIRIESWYLNACFTNFTCYCYKNGIREGATTGRPIDCFFDNFYICSDDMNQSYVGFDIYGTDSKYVNGRIYAFKIGMKARSAIVAENIHFLAANLENVVDFNNDYIAIMIDGNSWDSQLLNCYCDSYNTFVKVTANHFLMCNINGFKMNQYKQMTSGNGTIIDLTSANNRAHNVKIANAFVNNDNGYYNKFEIVKCPIEESMHFNSSSRFDNIVINNNDSSKFNMYNTGLNNIDTEIITRYTYSSVTNWVLIGHMPFVNAGTRAVIETENAFSGVKGHFLLSHDGNGAPTEIRRVSEENGHPRIGTNVTADGIDLYYTETQGAFYTAIAVKCTSAWYKITPPNNLIYAVAPITTNNTPSVVSPSA